MIVAIVLSLLTGIEVFTYFRSVSTSGRTLMPLLMMLMAIKFYLIAAYFMHLRYDKAVLRRFFLDRASAWPWFVYIIALLTFKLFASGVPH